MYRNLFFKHIGQTSPEPITFEVSRAEGIYLFDDQDRPYIDLISGIGVSNLGHSHPQIVEAVQKQAARYMHTMVYGEHIQAPQVALAAMHSNHLPPHLNNVYYGSSGSEAVEGAMKLAKKYTGRKQFLAVHKAYHGSTHGPLSLKDQRYFSDAFRPLLPGIDFIRMNDLDSLSLITEHIAGVIIETVQGEAGIQIPTKSYLDALRQKCTENGVLLIFDEIQAGMGRTGKLWAFEHYAIYPDVLLTSKAFGGGLPLGAFITDRKIMECLQDNPILGHINTFGGNPVCCAAGLAALNILATTPIIKEVATKSDWLATRLAKHPKVKEIRHLGFMFAIDLGSSNSVQKLIQYGKSQQLLFDWFLYNDESVRIAPPLIVTEQQLEHIAETLWQGLNHL